MNLEEFVQQLRNRQERGLRIEINAPAGTQLVLDCQQRLGVELPLAVRRFYEKVDGFNVETPRLRLYPIGALTRAADGTVEFAEFADGNPVSFLAQGLNEAGEWTIVNTKSRFTV